MNGLKDYCFLKVVLASTKIDKHRDKITLGALNELKELCLGRYGSISISEDCNTTCYISYTFIEPSSESDGTGEVAYNLYGIIIFDGSTECGKIIQDNVKNLGSNIYDIASVEFIVGCSETLTTQLVRNILSVKDFVSFTFNVRSKESVRNQNRLNEVIKGTDVCPFCGSKPIVSVDGENISGLDKFRITIKCMNIECHVQPKTSFYDSSFSTACDMALKHWNQRSSDSGIVDDDLEDTDSELTIDDICINCVDCINLKQDDNVFYCDKFSHRVRDVFTNTCESFVPQRSKAIYSFDYCDQCISYDCGYCKRRKRETNGELWMPCCQHDKKTQTDTRCCVNCVNCVKDGDSIYRCESSGLGSVIPGERPFKHTGCDDFEQKDSENLSCVSDESDLETETIEDRRSLCLSCVNAEFDKDGCFCKHLVRFVKCVGCKSCQYYEKEV